MKLIGATFAIAACDHKATTKTEIEGDIAMPYLGVKSIKKLSDACR